MERNRYLAVALGGIAVVALIVVVVAALDDHTATLDPATPEGVVQTYVRAVTDGDWATAHAVLDDDLATRCSIADLSVERVGDVARVTMDAVTVTGDTAVVDVTIVHSRADDPFDSSTWDEDVAFVLADVGGWRITELTWPYLPCRWETP